RTSTSQRRVRTRAGRAGPGGGPGAAGTGDAAGPDAAGPDRTVIHADSSRPTRQGGTAHGLRCEVMSSTAETGTAHPALSRRRELGATSARSLLLTVLGEFVLPRDEAVWTQVLIDVLGGLGVEPKSARQALARTAAEGLLVSDREGRRVRWSLS